MREPSQDVTSRRRPRQLPVKSWRHDVSRCKQLGHSSMAITADTYTSVLPAVAHAAAEAVADAVPRGNRRAGQGGRNDTSATPLAVRLQSDSLEGSVRTKSDIIEVKDQVRPGCAVRDSNPEPAD